MSPRPFDPEFLPEGHPDKIAVPPRRTASGAVWRVLVHYLLLPSYRGLVALGSMHVAGLWHPESGPLCGPPQQDPPGYRVFRAGLERRPEAWPGHPTPPVPPENRGDL
ncbi:hypothetical protein [Streptomyces poonensis]|uniref:Uncharacterized protein n=1 Tax=Streptomyces poonensis TaxID=68255 RepID=A0A918PID5_9ACTN|nr:hypothetical protein [Streptomyces poonensis]GGZ10848.1 hypothetical protein GCM10010365_32730 [Streptomyces poonensis]GLJ91669.1 hypothetical protein GCM10017589_42760 [Streptomyces poonensis]